MRSVLAFGAALAAFSVGGCGNEAAAPNAGAGIVFSQNLDGYNVVSTVQPTGGNPERLTGDPLPGTDSRGDQNPAWSPDGTRIAYVSSAYTLEEDDARNEVYVMNADGSDPQRLTHDDTLDSFPAWSPDGSRLALGRIVGWGADEVTGVIALIPADGGDIVEITHPEPNGSELVTLDSMPAWSPDGTRIAFTRFTYGIDNADFEDASFDIYTVEPDGSGGRHLLRDGADADWSPDGSRIVFTSTRDQNGETCFEECSTNGEIYLADADGTNVRRLTTNKADDGAPTWSPDGKQIVFVSTRSSRSDHPNDIEHELYVMSPRGGEPERLTTSNGVWAGDPDWR